MPREMVKAFFLHYDSLGWMGSEGRRIAKLSSALGKWKQRQAGLDADKGKKPKTYV
jgi:hypothetical protein